jgi:hypothetical protein
LITPAAENYAKRGGGAHQVSLDEGLVVSEERTAEVINVHEALERLAEFDGRKSQIVELRFFGGLSIEETAEVLAVSPGTVMRDWTLAKSLAAARNDDGWFPGLEVFHRFLALRLNRIYIAPAVSLRLCFRLDDGDDAI